MSEDDVPEVVFEGPYAEVLFVQTLIESAGIATSTTDQMRGQDVGGFEMTALCAADIDCAGRSWGSVIVVTIQCRNPALRVLQRSERPLPGRNGSGGSDGSADFFNAAPAIYGVVAVGISAVSTAEPASSSDAGPDAEGLNPPALPSPDS